MAQKRKQWKAGARRALRRHYWLFVALCLAAALIGVGFSPSVSVARARLLGVEESETNTGIAAWDVGAAVVRAWARSRADAQEGERPPQGADAAGGGQGAPEQEGVFGRSRGVLAFLINAVSSGAPVAAVWAAVCAVTRSRSAAEIVFTILSVLAFLFLEFFVINIYNVIYRRLFLEGRVYSRVPMQRFWFLLRVRRWCAAALTLLVTFLFTLLWSLTAAGGVIKHYSYWAVPYIVAENPSVAPRQAIRLSKAMMHGHKWECFVLDLSFLGWNVLSAATAGLVGIFYANPYKAAARCEFYTALRARAKEAQLPGSELLCDTYLFRRASTGLLRRTYQEAALTKPVVKPGRPAGVRSFLADNFGVLIGGGKAQRAYEETLEQQTRYAQELLCLEGKAYPSRLCPLWERGRRLAIERLHYMRRYSIWSLIVLFFAFAGFGWLWEVMLNFIVNGSFANRGVLHGPWLPIYGTGGVMILVLLYRLRSRPAAEFGAAVVLCGTVEYLTSVVLEATHGGARWWDYSGYFLNLNGRICAEGLLVFGVGALAIVYAAAPLIDTLVQKLPRRPVMAACIILAAAFTGDLVYSHFFPNAGPGVTDIGKDSAAHTAPECVRLEEWVEL